MTAHDDDVAQLALEKVLAENGLSLDTLLYREAVREALIPTETARVFRIAANATPSESVVDVYGQGHLVQAEEVGPGLAFAESTRRNWQETMEMRTMRAGVATAGAPSVDSVEVEVRLSDILGQGGRIYPVESVTVERAWYCTLPAGSVDVRAVG
jgi:hypothetical protein